MSDEELVLIADLQAQQKALEITQKAINRIETELLTFKETRRKAAITELSDMAMQVRELVGKCVALADEYNLSVSFGFNGDLEYFGKGVKDPFWRESDCYRADDEPQPLTSGRWAQSSDFC